MSTRIKKYTKGFKLPAGWRFLKLGERVEAGDRFIFFTHNSELFFEDKTMETSEGGRLVQGGIGAKWQSLQYITRRKK